MSKFDLDRVLRQIALSQDKSMAFRRLNMYRLNYPQVEARQYFEYFEKMLKIRR